MQLVDGVGTVERSLAHLLSCFNEELTALEVEILQRVHRQAQCDGDRTGFWDLWQQVTHAQEAAKAAVRAAHELVEQLLSAEDASGSLAESLERATRTVGQVYDALDRAFGVSRGGPLAELVATLGGTDGQRPRLPASLESAKVDAVRAVGELCLSVAVGGAARTLAA